MSKVRYPLQDLVTVRRIREDAAKRAVSQARNDLAAARRRVEEAREACERFRVWRIEEEKRSFERIERRDISLERLEEQKQEVRVLRDQQGEHERAILDAEAEVVACERRLAERTSEHRTAQKDLEKLEEHRQIWSDEQAGILARKEEDEMDDFRVAPRVAP